MKCSFDVAEGKRVKVVVALGLSITQQTGDSPVVYVSFFTNHNCVYDLIIAPLSSTDCVQTKFCFCFLSWH